MVLSNLLKVIILIATIIISNSYYLWNTDYISGIGLGTLRTLYNLNSTTWGKHYSVFTKADWGSEF